MLTFFDYLRQRAFESVLAGAREALEALEHQKNRKEPQAVAAQPSARSLDFRPAETVKQEESVATGEAPGETPGTEDDEPLPPARRRGRPDQKPKGNR